jgi:HAD superfamily hydrolase (TIGR01509 family)
MHHETHAVIFDMDGVIIDSEPLWRKAMVMGFNGIGLNFSEDDCRKTTGMRLTEVIFYWQKLFPDKLECPEKLHHSIIHNLINLINQQGAPMPGLIDLLKHLQRHDLKIGLSTSSDYILIEAVLNKLEIKYFFSEIISAQQLRYGKPHPEVYLTCAEKLNVHPMDCLVIEDSINGIISAKAAQMHVLAYPDKEHINNVKFQLADSVIMHLSEAKNFILKS